MIKTHPEWQVIRSALNDLRALQRSARAGRPRVSRDTATSMPVLDRIRRTSLHSGKELEALVELPESIRQALIARAEAGEPVSAVIELQRVRWKCRQEIQRVRDEDEHATP